MNPSSSVEDVVQRQLDTYNARDLEAWSATYAEDARQFEYPATLLATGRDEIRARMASRFAERNLHAKLLQRSAMGNIVIDREEIVRNFPDGAGTIEMICIYEVRAGFIHTASFIFGTKKLD